MASKMCLCKTCEKEIAASAKVCPHCGAKNRKPVFAKWWFWVILVFLLVGAIGSTAETENGMQAPTANDLVVSETQSKKVDSETKNSVFAGDCGISATAEMGTDIIGQPTVTVSITNTTNKDIQAIKFYCVPYDVYNDELTGIFSQNLLSTDDTVPAQESTSCSWQFLDDHVKTVKLYVYSVYFEDGTQWGDKDATKSTVLKNGLEIEVVGKS